VTDEECMQWASFIVVSFLPSNFNSNIGPMSTYNTYKGTNLYFCIKKTEMTTNFEHLVILSKQIFWFNVPSRATGSPTTMIVAEIRPYYRYQ